MKTLPTDTSPSRFTACRGAAWVATLTRCLLPVLCAGGVQAVTVYHDVTNTADHTGTGTLRTAITQVNAVPANSIDTHIIRFDITGGFPGSVNTINLLSALPSIIRNCIIDGTTANGYAGIPLVELNGSSSWNSNLPAYEKSAGLTVMGCKVTVKALAINRFWEDGIYCLEGELKLLGCRIGTNPAGTVAMPNQRHGVFLADSSAATMNHAIGDTTSNGRNIISGNLGHGIVISSNGGAGGEVVVENNFVGTTANGLAALPNQGDGVLVYVGTGQRTVRIGRTGSGRNIISGNKQNGVTRAQQQYYTGTTETYVRNNYIGLGVDGTTVVRNEEYGIRTDNQKITIGGSAAGEGNTISGNGYSGLYIGLYSGSAFDSGKTALVLGNHIGTAQDGLAARPNGWSGIRVTSAYGQARIGTTTTGNVIAGNAGSGIAVDRGGATLLRNLIGLNKNAGPLGNGGDGIEIGLGGEVNVGNSTVSGANIIGSNAGAGISISSDSTTRIAGNYIGVTATLTAVGNGGAGVEVFWDDYPSAGGIEIGGTGAGAGNSIAHNTLAGVRVTESGGQGAAFCSILGNSIWANGGLGIDLGPTGVLANDFLDGDAGANGRQNMPVITSATVTKVFGTLHSKPNSTYRIEIFAAEAHASGYGTGRTLLGATTAYTGPRGDASWAKNGLSLTTGQLLTATATLVGPPAPDMAGILSSQLQDTSEFCLNKSVSTPDFPDVIIGLSAATYTASETGGVLHVPVIRSGLTTAVVTMDFRTLDGTALAGQDYSATYDTVTFQSGETQKIISIPITADNTYELTENFRVQLYNPGPGVVPGTFTEATVTLPDADGVPILSIASSASILEGNSGNTLLPIQVYLSKAASYTTNVWCIIHTDVGNSGTASHPSDYEGGAVYISFAPGETQKSFNLIIHADTEPEPDESVIISVQEVSISGGFEIFGLTAPTIGAQNTCLAIILDDDDVSVFQFAETAASVAENSGTAFIAVTRTGGLGKTVSVNCARTSGTATPGTDYSSPQVPGQITFTPGQTIHYLAITLSNDGIPEAPETLVLQLSSDGTSNSTIGSPAQFTLTITDPPPPSGMTISGRIFDLNSGADLAGAVVTLDTDPVRTVITDATGEYAFTDLPYGISCTVSVALAGWVFTPASESLSDIVEPVMGLDFGGVPEVLPQLLIEVAQDGRIILSWPSPSTGWVLQRSPNLKPGSWVSVGITPTIRAGYKSVYYTPQDPAQFFRLYRP